MYICDDCGQDFDKPVYDEIDRHPYGMTYAREMGMVSPCCGTPNYEKAIFCDGCGALFPESETRDGLCMECWQKREDALYDPLNPYAGTDNMWDIPERMIL